MSAFTKLKHYTRRSLFQAFILGMLSFTQPGIWTALNIMGAGGLITTTTANVANSVLFAVMTITSPFFAVLANKIGLKWSLVIGVIGYVPYSAGLYLNSKNGAQWLVMLGAVTCGFSASLFWVAEGTAAVLYPSNNERGLFIGIWQFINKFGLVIGGAIVLALNIHTSTKGGVSLNTYAAFIAIQCAGILFVWFFVKPEKVIRDDGTSARSNIGNESIKDRFKKLGQVFKKKEVWLLAPLSLANMWFMTWQGNYITTYFSVRSRSLNTLVTAFVQMFADIIVGLLLDTKYFSVETKKRWSWHIISFLMTMYFVYSIIIQSIYDKNPVSGLDWTESGFGRGFIPFVLFKLFAEALNNWMYWIIGTMNYHSTELTYVVSIIRGLESNGEMWAFVIGAVNPNLMVSLAVSAGVFWLTVPPVTYLVHFVADDVAAKNIERNKVLDEEFKDKVDGIEGSLGNDSVQSDEVEVEESLVTEKK
ncbi:UNC93-like protein MFSD11 [Wickerhamomyces ciferrii]|uniref:UNC93-like protein MFSD11 n=1 Tax=Wickerhamomyces ciferrii (strain ATCC 14091 / BCRC 22168 / CBS 111 / JCM 3599 / NBRC 0793 / NRRL Y-1031 F-60-10) TaxID=1206466 RepID=K0KIB8_WICCF|nr:UNC93-like protein MFSD11 [Wickerhamomyces ciferrii]CCH42741.1 UNC93-like protein MFSD11 [Wickerhamomyces ciferrii]